MTSSKINRIPFLTITLLLAATLSFASTAHACAATESMNEISPPDNSVLALVAQLDCMLSSQNSKTREEAMQDIITLATRPHYAPSYVQWAADDQVLLTATDFRPLVPALLAAYANASDVPTRTMAAVALHAVGDEAGMQQLWTLADKERSPVLQNRMNMLLGDYFARTYPELKGDRSITRAKVKRAQRRAATQGLLGEAN